MTGKADLAVPVLAEALKHHKSTVRESAVRVLALIGPDARMAAPALREALKDDNPAFRESVAEALSASSRRRPSTKA